MYKKLYLVVSLLIFTFSHLFAKLEAVKGEVSNGYDYWLYTPETPQDSITVASGKPLFIFLHGASLCGSDLNKVRRYGTIAAIEKGRHIDGYVIAPQNPGGSWKPERVMKIVEHISDTYDVDTNRIYVLGMSLGGYGAIDFAATYPDKVAAAIGMCGGASIKNLDGLASMPLWLIHGTADRAVTINQSDKVAEAVKKTQNETDGVNRLSYDRVPGMNHSQPARIFYNMETYDWLLSHRLDTPDRPLTPTPSIDGNFLKSSYENLNHSKGYKTYKHSSKSKARTSKKKIKNKKSATSKKKIKKK